MDITVTRDIKAPPERVWPLVVTWERQSAWMPATTVRALPGPRTGVGTRVEAVTGYGPIKIVDPMEVVEWYPPRLCVVRHEGRALRGLGIFRADPLPDGRCRFTWREELEPPPSPMAARLFELFARMSTPFFIAALRRLDRLATRSPHTGRARRR